MPQLVLGTTNSKKALELADVLRPVGMDLATLADFADPLRVVEDGRTFAENAALKATRQARHLGVWVLAEDSGLMVDALQGAPGVLSARYSGPGATDASNNQKLLQALGPTPLDQRTARYLCHMTLADPSGAIRAESQGSCAGRIVFEPRGSHGFGYDPLFEIIEYHRTLGLLGPVVKRALSHRARAARRMIPALVRLADSGGFD
jgi:XTP/dITP diphosphohydrolase